VTSFAARFYETSSRTLLPHGALLGQIAGDEVEAIFVPGLATTKYRAKAVVAARALLEGVGYGSPEGNWVHVGVGIASGEEFVGNVAGGGYKDFVAIGDVTNTASRLTSAAKSGEIIVDADTYTPISDLFPQAEPRELELKGKKTPVKSYIIRIGSDESGAPNAQL
jgi:adenylate cyclase